MAELSPLPLLKGTVDVLVLNETELGFVQKSRSIKDLERIQAQNRCLRPDLRLN